MKQFSLILILSMLLSACASINSVSVTSIPAKKGTPIKAEGSRVIVLGLSFDNDFVDRMTEDLKAQCPNGEVKGILTKDETILYFLFVVYKRKVTATGYCQKNNIAMMTGIEQ